MCWKIDRLIPVVVLAGIIGILVGCQSNKKLVTSYAPDSANVPTPGAGYIYPSEPNVCDVECETDFDSLSPEAMIDYHSIQYTPISLSDCIARSLRDSEVFRDLGGAIIAQPGSMETTMDPALRFTDPSIGEDAALSAFDANFVSGLFFEKNDRPFNNRFSGDTDGILQQDLGEYNVSVSKLAATGTLFTSRTTVNFDNNNQAGNRFEGSAWEAIVDTGFRHPLLQGSGSLFNRIAGPSQTPGSYNGVLIARTNTEISLADFEESSREFVSNIENAYWDLYYAYRELNAQTDARDAALAVLKKTRPQVETKRKSELELASAKEQYLRFESAIIESLEGRPVEGTQANSGSSGGSFRRTVGVRVAERRLRYLMGMPITDGTLLKPADQPGAAATVFDWQTAVHSALDNRPETRRQRWIVKQKELELTAARNFLLPRLDLVGNYRFRGLGKNLTGGGESLRDDINSGATAANAESGAFSDLASGDFQEVQIGAELRMPIGYRRANAGVRNAELSVQRERSVMKEQERKIVLDLSNAIAEARRSHSARSLAEKRFDAARDYRQLAASRIDSGRSQMDVLLEAQRRILEAQLQFINAEVEYVIAIKNVHYEKGTFLRYHGVALSESESDPRAYVNADRRNAARGELMSYVVRDASIGTSPLGDAVITNGEFDQTGFVDTSMMPVDGQLMPMQEVQFGSGVETLTPSQIPSGSSSILNVPPPTPAQPGLKELIDPATSTSPDINGNLDDSSPPPPSATWDPRRNLPVNPSPLIRQSSASTPTAKRSGSVTEQLTDVAPKFNSTPAVQSSSHSRRVVLGESSISSPQAQSSVLPAKIASPISTTPLQPISPSNGAMEKPVKVSFGTPTGYEVPKAKIPTVTLGDEPNKSTRRKSVGSNISDSAGSN